MIVKTDEYNFEITKLPKEIKDKWVEALRSGKYKQGHGTLLAFGKGGTESSYCCLGVLGAVCGLKEDDLYLTDFLNQDLKEALFDLDLPQEIFDFVDNDALQQFLADNNDGAVVQETGEKEIGTARIQYPRATFKESADWIEVNL